MPEETKPPVEREAFDEAARNADWVQVVMNGGPPCFHFQPEYGTFCLRAERWFGHDGDPHKFVPLAEMLSIYVQASADAALERAVRIAENAQTFRVRSQTVAENIAAEIRVLKGSR